MNRDELAVIEAQHRVAAIAADNSRQALRRLRVLARKSLADSTTVDQAAAAHQRNQTALNQSRKRLAAAMRRYKEARR